MLWTGSDVFVRAPNASDTVAKYARHWCVAPWLKDELADVGISAEIVRMTPPNVPEVVPALPSDFTVLAYVIEGRGDLYGLDFILTLARKTPDISFRLLAATSVDDLPTNVALLGWVDDTRSIMAQTTIYIRPTSHDGLSNLVLEALANGRYVLWTYPFPGVRSIDGVDSAAAYLDELYRLHVEGRLSRTTRAARRCSRCSSPTRFETTSSNG